MFLRFNGLAEDRITAAVLLLHGPGRLFHVLEGPGFHGRGVRDHRLRRVIDFHDRAATGASHFEIGFSFCHTRMIPQSASARREVNGQNVEQVEHLPAEQYDRHDYDQYRQNFAKIQAALVRIKAARSQAQNVDRGKPKHQRPQNVVCLLYTSDAADE